MIYNLTIAQLVSLVSRTPLSLNNTGNNTGYLLYNDLPVQTRQFSDVFKIDNLKILCLYASFGTDTYPLSQRNLYRRDDNIYRVESGSWGYGDIYLECNDFPFRRSTAGKISIYFKGKWTPFCFGTDFIRYRGREFCEKFGLPSGYVTGFKGSPGNYTQSWQILPYCSYEDELLEPRCDKSIDMMSENTCNENHLYAINCEELDKSKAQVHLRGSGYDKLGVVTVTHEGGTGGVCAETLSNNTAVVVCRSLGFSTKNAEVLPITLFKPSSGQYDGHIFNGVSCLGNESSLFDCSYTSTKDTSCHPTKSLAVSCGDESGLDYSLRLEDIGAGDNVGRLQVLIHGIWGSVCNRGFTDSSAVTVCRELQKPTDPVEILKNVNNVENEVIWLSNVQCSADADDLSVCSKRVNTYACLGHSDDVVIRCGKSLSTTTMTNSGASIQSFKYDVIIAGVVLGFLALGAVSEVSSNP